jgi:hypothetical protein
MWKPNLNRHFAKIAPALKNSLKISFFLIVWNGLFHSLTLSILIYWSLTSTRVSEMSRMTTLNQFWAENQILFAALSALASIFFFGDYVRRVILDGRIGLTSFGINFLRGVFFSLLLIGALILDHRYEFLGFSAQLNLNFLTSYAWFFRALLMLLFVGSTEFVTRVVLRSELHDETMGVVSPVARYLVETLTHLSIYWIWFNPALPEVITLLLLFLLFQGFWSATGFISAFFIMVHAVFGLPFFENEFVGVLQLKPLTEELRGDESILQNHYLIATLILLVLAVRASRHIMLKSFRAREGAIEERNSTSNE